MFEISADVEGGGLEKHVACCFDPSMVLLKLQDSFPEMEIDWQDMAWRNYRGLKQHGLSEGGLHLAEFDAHRRGPIWRFRLSLTGQEAVRGHAERYHVSVWSENPLPEPFRSRFIAFLEQLRFGPWVTVKSVRLEHNDEFPA